MAMFLWLLFSFIKIKICKRSSEAMFTLLYFVFSERKAVKECISAYNLFDFSKVWSKKGLQFLTGHCMYRIFNQTAWTDISAWLLMIFCLLNQTVSDSQSSKINFERFFFFNIKVKYFLSISWYSDSIFLLPPNVFLHLV